MKSQIRTADLTIAHLNYHSNENDLGQTQGCAWRFSSPSNYSKWAQRHAVELRRHHIACWISRCKSPARNVHNPAIPHSAYSGRSTQQVDSKNLSAVSKGLLCCVHRRNDLTELTSCIQPTLRLIMIILNPLLYCSGNFIKNTMKEHLAN